MLPVLVVLSPLPRRHFGAAAGGVHPIITQVEPRPHSPREVAAAVPDEERGRARAGTCRQPVKAGARHATVTLSIDPPGLKRSSQHRGRMLRWRVGGAR